MARILYAKLLATALALSPLALVIPAGPAAAQVNVSISFGYFYDQLAPYGSWYHHARWGDVWRPTQAGRDFRPYYQGHWDYTHDYGWTWASDEEWGDIPSHYGRWVYDPSDGWLWVPGYVWAPAWVVWRSGGGFTGWFPMPPDNQFLAGDEVYRTNWDDWDRGFGYSDWYGPSYGRDWSLSFFTFVDNAHFADRDFHRYVPPRQDYTRFINNTKNVTNYTTVNNYIVNKSVNVTEIERASGRKVAEINPREIEKKNVPITPVNTGREVQQRERQAHGGDPKADPKAKPAPLPKTARDATPSNAGPNGAKPNEGGAGPQQQTGQRNGAPNNGAATNATAPNGDRGRAQDNADRRNAQERGKAAQDAKAPPQGPAQANAPGGPDRERNARERNNERAAQTPPPAQGPANPPPTEERRGPNERVGANPKAAPPAGAPPKATPQEPPKQEQVNRNAGRNRDQERGVQNVAPPQPPQVGRGPQPKQEPPKTAARGPEPKPQPQAAPTPQEQQANARKDKDKKDN